MSLFNCGTPNKSSTPQCAESDDTHDIEKTWIAPLTSADNISKMIVLVIIRGSGHVEIACRWDMKTESTLSAEALERLVTRRMGSQVRDLRLVIEPAGVILLGWSNTFYAKQVAQQIVMKL